MADLIPFRRSDSPTSSATSHSTMGASHNRCATMQLMEKLALLEQADPAEARMIESLVDRDLEMLPRHKHTHGDGARTVSFTSRPAGWRGASTVAATALDLSADAMVNPRPPAVPATLDLTLDEYFAATALMGLLAAQKDEPDPSWACEWALDMGALMAKAARKRRKR